MTRIDTFKCDGCGKLFTPRDGAGKIQAVGGATGFHEKMVATEKGELQSKLMQYSFDFCVECNKKLMDFAVKEFKL